ncbi:FG-GAP repeat domain-containing protein [Streptomyces sp. NPDC059352]|uniref:FG-GAP repeat domain-containing protein n=1 Tax=Streptomyces sp. NPDC059352 TaxID=3346810 RepID=UPI00368779DC
MSSARTTRRRLTTAVTTVLAATLGAGVLSLPATAAPASPASPATTVPVTAAVPEEAGVTADGTVQFPMSGVLSGAGRTGFLTVDSLAYPANPRWTRYADGTSTALPEDTRMGAAGSDVLVSPDEGQSSWRPRTFTLRDMATGAEPVKVDLTALGGDHRFAGLVDSTLLASGTNRDGASELLLLDMTGDPESARRVTGLPAEVRDAGVYGRGAGTALLGYYTGPDEAPSKHLVTVDLTTAAVRGAATTIGAGGGYPGDSLAVSDSSVAWPEYADDGYTGTLALVDRATGEIRRTPLGHRGEYGIGIGLVGEWVTYASPSDLYGRGTAPLGPLRARSSKTGETIALLSYMSSAAPGPDGTLLARGGTVEKGEGLYRIAAGEDGRPTTELVASTGEPTKLTYLGDEIPDVLDLDRSGGETPLTWKLSRLNTDVYLKLTHRRTGQTYVQEYKPDGPRGAAGTTLALNWWENYGFKTITGKAAQNGDYDWSLRAVPQNGIGPEVTASGSFKVVRAPKPHDLDDNGAPDLLARDAQGLLWQVDTHTDTSASRLTSPVSRKRVGHGWNIYDRIESVGDIGGRSNAADFVARDRSGVLWLYSGAGTGSEATFPARTRIGGGWNTYTRFTGGSDLTGDGRPDLVATDKAGDLWLYKANGGTGAPFAARKRIGHGWGIYNHISATGNLGGNGTGDLVARDTAGVLWLYLGKGDGTFAPRRKIGGGWNQYSEIVGIGDGNKDGHPDLYGYGPANTSYFHAGTGDYSAPFATRTPSGALLGGGVTYDSVS